MNRPATVTRVTGTVYTCPMHPEIRSSKPGECPTCAMKLEPVKPKKESGGTTYTCPMHPEVTSPKPGECPKCGMKLESKKEKK